MALKTLESRIRYRLSRSKDLVFTPMDFLDLSDRDRTGRVLRKLVVEQSLVRIVRGLYAKTRIPSATGEIIPAKPLPVLAKEGLIKSRHYNRHANTMQAQPTFIWRTFK